MKTIHRTGARLSRALIVALLLWQAGSLHAQQPAPAAEKLSAEQDKKLPSAKEVIDRYLKEIGGKEAFLKIESQSATGTMEMPGQGISGKLEVSAKRPSKFLMVIRLPGLGDMTSGYDGKTGWMSTALTGPMLLEGPMLDELKDKADFNSPLHEEEDYSKMEITGLVNFEGKPAYALQLVEKSGKTSTEYYEAASGLLIGMVGTQESPLGPMTATTILGDYKKFGDLLFATRTEVKTGPMTQVLKIATMDFSPLPDSKFDPPKDIKELAK